MGALQALIPLGIITGALGVFGNLIGWVPLLFGNDVSMLARRRIGRAQTHTPAQACCLRLARLAASHVTFRVLASARCGFFGTRFCAASLICAHAHNAHATRLMYCLHVVPRSASAI